MDLQSKKKFKSDIEPHDHSFEAVVSFKEYYDRHDQFFTYKINDRRGNLLNECLRKVSCDGNYKFNPVGWCADMAGANLVGFTEVFGETVHVRIKACEFPFKDHRNKNARKLDADVAAEFMTLCDNLLLSATEAAYYESSKAEIEEFYCNKGRAVDFVILGLVVARKTGFHFLRICTSRRAENESSRGHSHWVGVQGPP